MQHELKLNRLQRYKLYEKLLPLGKGRPHWRRLQRLHDQLGIEAIEDMFESNRELQAEHRAAVVKARAENRLDPPAPELGELKITDPLESVQLEEGDLEYIHRKTRTWDEENEGPDGNEWRVMLPLMDEIDRAWEAAKAAPSKSNGDATQTASAEPEAENATA